MPQTDRLDSLIKERQACLQTERDADSRLLLMRLQREKDSETRMLRQIQNLGDVRRAVEREARAGDRLLRAVHEQEKKSKELMTKRIEPQQLVQPTPSRRKAPFAYTPVEPHHPPQSQSQENSVPALGQETPQTGGRPISRSPMGGRARREYSYLD